MPCDRNKTRTFSGSCLQREGKDIPSHKPSWSFSSPYMCVHTQSTQTCVHTETHTQLHTDTDSRSQTQTHTGPHAPTGSISCVTSAPRHSVTDSDIAALTPAIRFSGSQTRLQINSSGVGVGWGGFKTKSSGVGVGGGFKTPQMARPRPGSMASQSPRPSVGHCMFWSLSCAPGVENLCLSVHFLTHRGVPHRVN